MCRIASPLPPTNRFLIRSMNPVRSITLAILVSLPLFGSAQDATTLHPVPLEQVSINDAFWSPKRTIWQNVTINDCFDKFERDGAFENFDRLIAGQTGGHRGAPWFDGLVLEMIRGANDFLRSNPDAALQARIDGYVTQICKAAKQDPNCFLSSYTQLEVPDQRWGRNGGKLRFQHDVYNAGCLFEAAAHYYWATGNTNLLEVALRLANHMAETFGLPPKVNVIPAHALPEEALVKLSQVLTQHPELSKTLSIDVDANKILDLAKLFVELRGKHDGRESFGQYAQDDVPIRDQKTIEGHAVRATLLYGGLAAIAKEDPQSGYFAVADRMWRNMTGQRMYVTGGVGAIADDEKFGADYELPNDGYLETCGAVGAGFYHLNLHQVSPDAKYIDQFERVLYNAVLSGVSQSGDRYLYESPLTAPASKQRWDWHACPCCPPMFLKLTGALPGYVYCQSDDAAYVNLFIGSEATVRVGEHQLQLRQQTTYPFGGQVRLQVSPVGEVSDPLKLNVRIPEWCQGFKIAINGNAIDQPTLERGYASLLRTWKPGDEVTLDFEMPVQTVSANPQVKADLGRVSFQKGPLVYCFEEIDNTDRLRFSYLSETATAVPSEPPSGIVGIESIRVKAKQRLPVKDDESLYGQDVIGDITEDIELVGIPFFAHSNRGPTGRQTWMPTTILLTEEAKAETIASQGTWTASHCWTGDTIAAVNDQVMAEASDDDSIPRFTWWDHRGTSEWLQVELAKPSELRSVEVYWWDERRVNRHCRVPATWRVLHQVDGTWKPIAGQSEGPVELDQFNKISFPPTTVQKLRLEVQLQPNWSAGILEIQLH